MKYFILMICTLAICLSSLSCTREWDNTWHFDGEWTSELTVRNQAVKSQKQIDKIAIICTTEKHSYETLTEFMEQKPFIITDREKIISLIDAITCGSEAIHDYHGCSPYDSEYYNFHIVVFDSSNMRTAYIMVLPCTDNMNCQVVDCWSSGTYWIKTPELLKHKLKKRAGERGHPE